MNKIKTYFDKFFSILIQYITLIVISVWLALTRTQSKVVDVKQPIDKNRPTVIISNHMTRIDPTTVYTAFGYIGVFKMAPVKFMTAARYYHSIFKPYLFSIGCYPHKGNGRTGVEGSLYYIKNGYKIFMFPEGRMNKSYRLDKAYPGICKILKQTHNPRIILVNIFWEERQRVFSRPKLRIIVADAPQNIDNTNEYKIMEEVYALPDRFGIK